MDDWRPDRTALGYAVLLSVPVGVGVAGAMMRGTGGGPFATMVVIPGAVATVVVFLLVVAGAAGEAPGA